MKKKTFKIYLNNELADILYFYEDATIDRIRHVLIYQGYNPAIDIRQEDITCKEAWERIPSGSIVFMENDSREYLKLADQKNRYDGVDSWSVAEFGTGKICRADEFFLYHETYSGQFTFTIGNEHLTNW